MLTESEYKKNLELYLNAHLFCCRKDIRVSSECIAYGSSLVRIVVQYAGKKIYSSRTYTQQKDLYSTGEDTLKRYEVCMYFYLKLSKTQDKQTQNK